MVKVMFMVKVKIKIMVMVLGNQIGFPGYWMKIRRAMALELITRPKSRPRSTQL